MFARNISIDEVKLTIEKGEVIKEYPDDKPYPSFLISSINLLNPLHVVIAENKQVETGIVITAYKPDELIWENNFKKRK